MGFFAPWERMEMELEGTACSPVALSPVPVPKGRVCSAGNFFLCSTWNVAPADPEHLDLSKIQRDQLLIAG